MNILSYGWLTFLMVHLLNGLPSDQFKFKDFGNNMGTQWISSSINTSFSGNFSPGVCGQYSDETFSANRQDKKEL